MTGKSGTAYVFDSYILSPEERTLKKDGELVHLSPRAFDILVILVQNNGSLVEKQDLIEEIWHGHFVEEANLQVQVSSIRKALNDKDNGKYIETIPKRGYRFNADVRYVESLITDASDLVPLHPADISAERVRKRSRLPLIAAAALGIGCLALFLYISVTRARINTKSVFLARGVKLLTDSGSAFGAALSPDGKYAVYQTTNSGKYSLWLMDLGTKTSVQITPPGETEFGGITFSPSDDFIFYTALDKQPNPVNNIYRMSRLGGESKKIVSGINSPMGFSGNGQQFAFIRQNRETGETALIIANSDGTDEKTISTRKAPDVFST